MSANKAVCGTLCFPGHKDEAAGATGKESSSNTLGAARYSGKGLLSSGTTGDLRELEAALEAVHFSTSSGAPQQDSGLWRCFLTLHWRRVANVYILYSDWLGGTCTCILIGWGISLVVIF